MSFYDDASWLLVPSGIEEDIVFAQKPTSGLGDLTFTRASDATYTDASGVVRRSPYNLLQQSEMFSNAIWGKVNSSISIDATLAPNGTLTADKLVENTVNDQHRLDQTSTSQAIQNTFSVYAKRAERNFIQLRLGGAGASFDLLNGTFGGVNAGVTASISDAGNGWYRCAITRTTAANEIARINIGTSFTLPSSYAGDGTSGIFIWGAQLVEGTEALDYFPTTNRQDVPRIDFRNADGTLSSCGRLLLEPQRTNSIRNSSMVGAVAGTPGTLPTNWSVATSGLTRTIVGIGTENGLPYIDYRFAGTSSVTFFEVFFETTTQIAASNGQSWTSGVYVKTIATPNAPNSYALNISERTSTGVYVANGTQSISIDSTLKRYTQTRTLSGGATVAVVLPSIVFNLTNGAAYDFTIRIAAPQMELGAYATTWVPTTTAAVTRLADAASKTGVSSLIGQTEGTLFAEVDIKNVVAATRGILEIRTTGTQTIALICFSNGNLGGYIINGTDQFVRSITTVAGRYKMALAYSAASTVLYINGQIVGSASTSVSVPTTSAVQVGIYGIANHLGDSITQAALFTTRLPNATLAQLTTL